MWRNVLPVRIAQVSDCFAPRTGGIETQVSSLALRQVADGHEVSVITATPDRVGTAGPADRPPLPVRRIATRLPFDLPVHPRTSALVAQALKENPVDVVHVHLGVVSPFAWGAIRAALRSDIPVLVTVHSMWGPFARPSYSLVGRLNERASSRIVFSAVSSSAAAQVAQALPGVGSVRIVANGIDEAVWAGPPGDRADRGSRKGIDVVSVLRMAPRKRTVPLLRIVHEAILQGAPVRLTVIGDGPDRAKAERYVSTHKLEASIQFTGRLGGEEMRTRFASSDLFIQPSVHESFGIAALEARTAGLPVLARSQTGTVDFIRDGREGVIVDDDAAMSRALVQLAGDRPTLSRMSQHNVENPPEQVWDRVLVDVDAAYAAAIEMRS